MDYITITELKNRGSQTASVRDYSPRGYKTISIDEVKPGDEVIIDNHFTTVTNDTYTEDVKHFDRCRAELETKKTRSAWDKGVKAYAFDILDVVQERAEGDGIVPETYGLFKDFALNGAKDYQKPGDLFAAWSVASWGGSYLIYDGDIARRLCNPSELKRTDNGNKRPNPHEQWLDVQARALYHAFNLLSKCWRDTFTGGKQ